MSIDDPRNPFRRAFRIAYWIGCALFCALGVAFLAKGLSEQTRYPIIWTTVGSVVIGMATSLIATALMELMTLNTSVAELRNIIAESMGMTFYSVPSDLDRHAAEGRRHHYSQTLLNGRPVWQYAEIVFRRVHPGKMLGFGVWKADGQQVDYTIEVGIRGSRTVLIFRTADLHDSVPPLEIYDAPLEAWVTPAVQCGIGIDRGWGGGDHVTRAVLSVDRLTESDSIGILPESRYDALDALWNSHFGPALIWSFTKVKLPTS
jgi:hypothetical protein